MSTKTENAYITMLDFFSKYNEHKVSAMMELFANEANVAFLPLGTDGDGRAKELGNAIWSQLIASFPDIRCEILKSKFNDKKLICEVRFSGKQAKDFPGIPSKGLNFETDHIFVFKFNEQDLIDDLSVTWDHQDLCKQLGYQTQS